MKYNQQEWTARSPNGRKTHGDGVSILGYFRQNLTKVRQFRTIPLSTAINYGTKNGGINLHSNIERVENIYIQIYNFDNLIKIYQSLKLNFPLAKLQQISEELKTENFQPKPSKKIVFTKSSGKLKSLAIPSLEDQIVLVAMKKQIEIIFENKFLLSNHSYKPNQSPHSTLKQIAQWKDINWIIEGDLKGFFDNIDFQILAKLLERHIKDQRFIDLYWKFAKAGYFYFNQSTPKGISSETILSPLFLNIYLHELDSFVSRILTNLEHSNLTDIESNQTKTLKANIQFFRIRGEKVDKGSYARYADQWVIGLRGTKATALTIVHKIKDYLKTSLNIELSDQNPKLTNVIKGKAHFLGFDITRNVRIETKLKVIGKSFKNLPKVNDSKLKFYMPFQDILLKLAKLGFFDKTDSGKIKPKSIPKFIYLDHSSILQKYNSILIQFFNYFSVAHNASKLHQIAFILKHSCAKTLARKFNLKTRNFTFRKFGPDLAFKDKNHTIAFLNFNPLKWPSFAHNCKRKRDRRLDKNSEKFRKIIC